MTICTLSNLLPEGSLSLLTKYSDNAFRLRNFYILFHFLKSIIILLEICNSAYISAKAEMCYFGTSFCTFQVTDPQVVLYAISFLCSIADARALHITNAMLYQFSYRTSLLSLTSRTYGAGNVMHYGKNVLRLLQSIVQGTARK